MFVSFKRLKYDEFFFCHSLELCIFCSFLLKNLLRHWNWWNTDMELKILWLLKTQAYYPLVHFISPRLIRCTGDITRGRTQIMWTPRMVSALPIIHWSMATNDRLQIWGRCNRVIVSLYPSYDLIVNFARFYCWIVVAYFILFMNF